MRSRDMEKSDRQKPSGRRKTTAWLIGGTASGIGIGAAIGFIVWSPLEGLALGLALGSGMGGVPAALYYFGDLE